MDQRIIPAPFEREWVFMIKVCNHTRNDRHIYEIPENAYLRTSRKLLRRSGNELLNGAKQGVDALIKKKNAANKGVIIRQNNNKLIIDLHITVTYGVNVKAITESIAHKVDYVLTEQAGISVESVNVYVDGMVN